MDRERKLFQVFLALHSKDALPTDEPCCYLKFHSDDPSVTSPLIRFTRDDLIECDELDKDSTLVRYLIKQVSTYDCKTQRVLGLVFDSKTVLSDVFVHLETFNKVLFDQS